MARHSLVLPVLVVLVLVLSVGDGRMSNNALFVLGCIVLIPGFVWVGRMQWRAWRRSPFYSGRPTRIAKDPNDERK